MPVSARNCAHPEGCGQVAPSYNRRAEEEGWFFTRPTHPDGAQAFCPAHIPAWVAGWRARQEITVRRAALPKSAGCAQCPWRAAAAGTGDAERADLLEAVRAHVREKRHQVRVVTGTEALYSPALEAAAAR